MNMTVSFVTIFLLNQSPGHSKIPLDHGIEVRLAQRSGDGAGFAIADRLFI